MLIRLLACIALKVRSSFFNAKKNLNVANMFYNKINLIMNLKYDV
jgi:hypothetical protein